MKYTDFFGLSADPFKSSPHLLSLFVTRHLEEVIEELSYGVEQRKGLLVLTGEPGAGKTALTHHLVKRLRRTDTSAACVVDSSVEIDDLYELILNELGVESDWRGNARLLLKQRVLDCYRGRKNVVVILDEAENMRPDMMEEIRMLLNLETPREKMLQILLVGRPELDRMLLRPELLQFRQRIGLRCKMIPFTFEETRSYVQTRLQVAAATVDSRVFSSEAVCAVHAYSRGIPGIMNLLCENALVKAYAGRVRPVPGHLVTKVAREFHLDKINASGSPMSLNKIEREREVALHSTKPGSRLFEVAKRPVKHKSPSVSLETQPASSKVLHIPVVPLNGPESSHALKTAHLESIGQVSKCNPEVPWHEIYEALLGQSPSRQSRPVDIKQGPSSAARAQEIRLPAGAPTASSHPSEDSFSLYFLLRVNGWKVKWMHRFSFITPSSWGQILGGTLRWLEAPVDPVRTIRRWWAGHGERYAMAFAGLEWTQVATPFCRWLREPYDPLRWLRTRRFND